MVLGITHGDVAVRRDFLITTAQRCSNVVRVQVSASLSMKKADSRTIANETQFLGLGVIGLIVAVRVDEPVVVGVLVVVASNLLLLRSLGVGLNVLMQEAAAIAHILECCTGAVCDL